ncbi:MAG: hypothetical protein OEN56_14260, partial [Gemmatimonadota bacterium]|nr:hypothetical protein [Gemmatimonadota bacterium]
PVWLAYQDGAGPWTPVSAVGNTYTFNVAATTAAIAVSTEPAPGESGVFVYYATRAEMVTADLDELCTIAQSGKTVNASVAGIETLLGEGATISLGEAWVSTSVNGPIAINDVADGNLDLVGYKWSPTGATDRMFLRRDVNVPGGTDIGTIDFAGAEAFFPTFATITVQGGSGGFWSTEYATSPSPGVCYYASLDDDFFPGATQFVVGGAPAARQEAGDFHYVAITDGTGLSFVSELFSTMAPRTISHGAALPAPTITDITGTAGYRRVRVELTLPAEYDELVTFALVDDPGAASIVAIATAAWLGGQNVSLETPDFTGLGGWNDAWAPTNASTTDWAFSAFGWTGTDCVEGAREVNRTAIGTVG